MTDRNWRGIFNILQTPFDESGGLLWEDFERESDFLVRTGSHGYVWPVMASEFTVLATHERIEGMKRAVLAGVRSIEHGTFMNEEIMRLMKERGTYYVPTISAGRFVADKSQEQPAPRLGKDDRQLAHQDPLPAEVIRL